MRCFLANESVSGRREPCLQYRNNGSLEVAGITQHMAIRALTGQRGEVPKAGMVTVVNEHLSWIVLDHLINITTLWVEKIRSQVHNCLVISKVVTG